MKKLLLGALILGSTAFTFSSCNKIVDEIKKHIDPFNYNAPEVTLEIQAPIEAGKDFNASQQTFDLNINQIIKDNAGISDVSLDDISKITLEKITLHLNNGNDENNWTNFESASVSANTDKGVAAGKPALTASQTIADDASQKDAEQVISFADNNLKDYVNGEGTKVTYSFSVHTRKAITNNMSVTAKIQYSFKP